MATDFRVMDDFYDHPKSFDAPDCAIALWTRAGSWCMSKLTDGFVPAGMASRLCDDPERAVKELLDRRLWVAEEGGYRFHGFLDRQRSRAQVEEERRTWAAKKASQRAAAQARRAAMSPGASPEVSPVMSPGDTLGDSTVDSPQDSPEESPEVSPGESRLSLPFPSLPFGEGGVGGGIDGTGSVDAPDGAHKIKRRKPEIPIPEDFVPTAEMLAWAAQKHPGVDTAAQTEQFVHHAAANDRRQRDWNAAWRTWIARATTWSGSRGAAPARPGGAIPAADRCPNPRHIGQRAGACRICRSELVGAVKTR